jgi:hypothetical protein
MEFDNQPKPVHNTLPAVWELVKQDMTKRNEFGTNKYGTPLQPFNGRDVLQDAYEEALDLCVYLRQAIYERNSKAVTHDTSSYTDPHFPC